MPSTGYPAIRRTLGHRARSENKRPRRHGATVYVRRKRCERCGRDNAAAKKKQPDGAPGLYRLHGLPGVLGAFDTSVNWHPFLCQPLCRQVMDHDQGRWGKLRRPGPSPGGDGSLLSHEVQRSEGEVTSAWATPGRMSRDSRPAELSSGALSGPTSLMSPRKPPCSFTGVASMQRDPRWQKADPSKKK